MTLAQLIQGAVGDIVSEWEQFARTSIPPAQDLSPEELRDHARLLLLAVAADLQTVQGGADQHDKSRGELPDNSPRITETAHQHARHRFDQRFTLDQMLSEIRALRASVLRRWVDQCAHYDREAVEELIRFGEAMDQALTEAVTLFGAKVDESRSLLFGVLGHDIRTPLGAIRMSGQLLERTRGLDERQLKAVQRIISSSDSMRTMVDDILDFTQTSLGVRLPIARAACDLKAICTDVVAELEALHPERKVQLVCEGDLAGKWDAGRIGQMVSNLVRNAILHGDAARPVTVTVKGRSDDVTIDVHNEGDPIPAETMGGIFEPLDTPRTWAATAIRVRPAWAWACISRARLRLRMADPWMSFRHGAMAPGSPPGCTVEVVPRRRRGPRRHPRGHLADRRDGITEGCRGKSAEPSFGQFTTRRDCSPSHHCFIKTTQVQRAGNGSEQGEAGGPHRSDEQGGFRSRVCSAGPERVGGGSPIDRGLPASARRRCRGTISGLSYFCCFSTYRTNPSTGVNWS